MKTLYILRHAKASNDYPDIDDIDRPLKQRGIQEAVALGKQLKKRGILPDVVLTSDAARATHTATIVAREIHLKADSIHLQNDLYLPRNGAILQRVQSLTNRNSSAMVVSHNPGVSTFCSEMLDEFPLEIPTCGLVAICFDTDSWEEISAANSQLAFTIY